MCMSPGYHSLTLKLQTVNYVPQLFVGNRISCAVQWFVVHFAALPLSQTSQSSLVRDLANSGWKIVLKRAVVNKIYRFVTMVH
jgi:hypothetical protein